MASKEITLKVSVSKVVELLDNEILTEKESATILNQFKKSDLIDYLTKEEEDLEEEVIEVPPKKTQPKEVPFVPEIDDEDEDLGADDDEDEDLEELDLE